MLPVPRAFVLHGVVFLSGFLDVRLDERKIFTVLFTFMLAGSFLPCFGGDFLFGFFSPLEFLGLQGSFVPVCSVLED